MAGPHEILGMSRLLGIGTTEFLSRYAGNGGTTLRSDAEGRCVFVTPDGCKVHPRRPLVCRLYPLGRWTDGAGDEKFAVFPEQEGCEARAGTDGTVAAFLESQGVAPYLDWSVRYGRLFRRMLRLLDRLEIRSEVETGAVGGPAEGAPGEAGPDAPISPWQDVDASLAEYCAAKGIPAPAGIGEAIDLHLAAMREWLDGLEAEAGGFPEEPEGESGS